MKKQKKRKILILDDEPDVLELLRMRFESNQCEVVTGIDGYEGLVKMRREIPDLVIMDVMMPKIDGLEFFKTLKKNPSFTMTPVVVLTVRRDLQKTFEKLGCDYFASKPFRADELVRKCTELMKPAVLVYGTANAFLKLATETLGENDYRLTFVEYADEFFHELAHHKFHLGAVHLAGVKDRPDVFMEHIGQVTENPGISILIVCDETVEEFGPGRSVQVVRAELEWMKSGNVVFYDSRIKQMPLAQYLFDQGIRF